MRHRDDAVTERVQPSRIVSAALAIHPVPRAPGAVLACAAAALACAIVLQTTSAVAQPRGVGGAEPAGPQVVPPATWAEPLSVRQGPAAGQVTVAFRSGASEIAIRRWADRYELSEVSPS